MTKEQELPSAEEGQKVEGTSPEGLDARSSASRPDQVPLPRNQAGLPYQSFRDRFNNTFTLGFDLKNLVAPLISRHQKKVAEDPRTMTRRQVLKVIGKGAVVIPVVAGCAASPTPAARSTSTPKGEDQNLQVPTAEPKNNEDSTKTQQEPPKEDKTDNPPLKLTEELLSKLISGVGGKGVEIVVTTTPSGEKKTITVDELANVASNMFRDDIELQDLSRNALKALEYLMAKLEYSSRPEDFGFMKLEDSFPSFKKLTNDLGLHIPHLEWTSDQDQKVIDGAPRNFPIRNQTHPSIIGISEDGKEAYLALSIYDPERRGGAAQLFFVAMPVTKTEGSLGYSLNELVGACGGVMEGNTIVKDGEKQALNIVSKSLAEKIKKQAGLEFVDRNEATVLENPVIPYPSDAFLKDLDLEDKKTVYGYDEGSGQESLSISDDTGTKVVARAAYDTEKNIWVWNPEEVRKMPVLKIEGSKFVDINGNTEVLKGAVSSHFVYDPEEFHNAYKPDIDKLVNMGGNFIIFEWNSGYFSDPTYIPHLLEAIKYAGLEKGLRVELVLHSRGTEDFDYSKGYIEEKPITTYDESILNDWKTLMSADGAKDILKKYVDIINPLSEPQKIAWSDWKSLAENVISTFRNEVNSDAIGMISGTEFASKAQAALSDPPTIGNTGIEIHPYQWTTTQKENYQATIQAALQQGMLVLAGEIGFNSPLQFTKSEVNFFKKNGISFAWFGLNSARKNKDFIINNGVLTPNGTTAEESFH